MEGRRAGGKKGTPNKVTATGKAAAAEEATEAVRVLARIMRNTEAPPAARVGAAKEILDRAAGKVPPALPESDSAPLIQRDVHHHFHA